MKRLKFVFGIIIGILVMAIVGFTVSVPIVNDGIANKTAKSIIRVELPNDTEYIESFSKAGKLIGNGNGMQYLGGILIRSELSLEELQTYYSQYAKNNFELTALICGVPACILL